MGMKTLLSIFLLVTVSAAAEDKIVLKLTTLAAIPRERQAALLSNAITGHDSTPDISTKRRAYFAALKALAEKLRKEYYWHQEFPPNVFAGLEQRAEVLVAAHYPASSTTGASYMDMLREDYMNEMAEEVVVSMAREICARTKDSDVQVVGKPSAIGFQQWERDWILAGDVKGAPTPTETLRKVRGEQDGAANGSQPIRSQTNRTSSAAGSRR
jgi:hypothetical protein